ncbi:prolyl oligopeptidase family serine peptidase [Pedobacter sp. BS3]|uniref:carboxylesterase family protein n=1 Tax=Pedobacter sp. BS3 TaxID=2567937 RepID=UPI0011EEA5A7|nr:prolyl oligopeptidase family serine peptidase [Pedobacter sp. BS3]TZF83161.1 prolyl oligopeptidase family serine peptidase [Pedobacter sp. BS3]
MQLKSFSILLFIAAGLLNAVNAQNRDFYEKSTFVSGKDTLPYRILFPRHFDANRKYPLLVFLHGRGESGTDNQSQLVHGADLFLRDSIRANYPAIIVFPQCPKTSYWSNVHITTDSAGKRYFDFRKGGPPTSAMKLVLKLMKQLRDKPFVDKSRVYAGGLSMGGMGTFELLRRKPYWFASAFAICGGDNPANVRRYRKVPLWIFHGAKDDIVPPAASRAVVDQLKQYSEPVKYTVYPNANHNSWDAALAEPDLLHWLFSH